MTFLRLTAGLTRVSGVRRTNNGEDHETGGHKHKQILRHDSLRMVGNALRMTLRKRHVKALPAIPTYASGIPQVIAGECLSGWDPAQYPKCSEPRTWRICIRTFGCDILPDADAVADMCGTLLNYHAVQPPSIRRFCPVM